MTTRTALPPAPAGASAGAWVEVEPAGKPFLGQANTRTAIVHASFREAAGPPADDTRDYHVLDGQFGALQRNGLTGRLYARATGGDAIDFVVTT